MRFEYLLCFEAVKRCHNFSKAAESLYITQSALSKQIKSLEDELGVILFKRNHSTIELTPIGERVSIYIEMILNEYDRMMLETKDYLKKENEKLRIASFYEMSQYGITDLIVQFEHDKPDFYIESKECDHLQMFQYLQHRQTDVIIGYQELWPKATNYQLTPLKKDDIVLVVNENHSLAQKDMISLADVCHEWFCFPREDESLFKLFYETCTSAGFVPNHTLSNVRLGTIKRYIREGMRITLQTRIRATNFFNESIFHLINIKESPSLTLSIMTNDNSLSEIGKNFIQFAYEFYNTSSYHPEFDKQTKSA